jgi:hypothetical protein
MSSHIKLQPYNAYIAESGFIGSFSARLLNDNDLLTRCVNNIKLSLLGPSVSTIARLPTNTCASMGFDITHDADEPGDRLESGSSIHSHLAAAKGFNRKHLNFQNFNRKSKGDSRGENKGKGKGQGDHEVKLSLTDLAGWCSLQHPNPFQHHNDRKTIAALRKISIRLMLIRCLKQFRKEVPLEGGIERNTTFESLLSSQHSDSSHTKSPPHHFLVIDTLTFLSLYTYLPCHLKLDQIRASLVM